MREWLAVVVVSGGYRIIFREHPPQIWLRILPYLELCIFLNSEESAVNSSTTTPPYLRIYDLLPLHLPLTLDSPSIYNPQRTPNGLPIAQSHRTKGPCPNTIYSPSHLTIERHKIKRPCCQWISITSNGGRSSCLRIEKSPCKRAPDRSWWSQVSTIQKVLWIQKI